MRAYLLALVIAVFTGGCAATRAYNGAARPEPEVAIIVGTREQLPLTFNIFAVEILAINGQRKMGSWKGPTSRVELLPGTYELDVHAKYVSGGPAVLIAAQFADEHKQSFSIDVVGGYTYEINYDGVSGFYLLSTYRTGQRVDDRGPQAFDQDAYCRRVLGADSRQQCLQTRLPDQADRLSVIFTNVSDPVLYSGTDGNVHINLDGRPIGTLAIGDSVTAAISPGKHLLHLAHRDIWLFANEYEIQFDASIHSIEVYAHPLSTQYRIVQDHDAPPSTRSRDGKVNDLGTGRSALAAAVRDVDRTAANTLRVEQVKRGRPKLQSYLRPLR